jgi:hypothetical protein
MIQSDGVNCRQFVQHPGAGDGHSPGVAASNQPRVRLQNAHTLSMTGTSTNTPTTVASAAPDSGP